MTALTSRIDEAELARWTDDELRSQLAPALVDALIPAHLPRSPFVVEHRFGDRSRLIMQIATEHGGEPAPCTGRDADVVFAWREALDAVRVALGDRSVFVLRCSKRLRLEGDAVAVAGMAAALRHRHADEEMIAEFVRENLSSKSTVVSEDRACEVVAAGARQLGAAIAIADDGSVPFGCIELCVGDSSSRVVVGRSDAANLDPKWIDPELVLRIRLDPTTFAELLSGRLSMPKAALRGGIAMEGNLGLLEHLARMLGPIVYG